MALRRMLGVRVVLVVMVVLMETKECTWRSLIDMQDRHRGILGGKLRFETMGGRPEQEWMLHCTVHNQSIALLWD